MSTPRGRRAPNAIAAERAAAFEEAALPHREQLLAAALRYTRNRADAEDLLQETFSRALAAWPRFKVGSNCRAWLFRILTNTFISGYRKKRRYDRFAHETGDACVAAFYGEDFEREGNPQDQVIEGLGDETLRALGELGPDYLDVIVRADLGGVRYRDIAKELRIPIGTVMSRLFRARRQLEASLRDFAAADYGIRRAAA